MLYPEILVKVKTVRTRADNQLQEFAVACHSIVAKREGAFMSLITWTNDLSVAVPEMDRQHKKLVDMINNLHDAMKSGQGREVLAKTLRDMVAYANIHFQHEEKMLETAGYSDLAAHKKMHESFRVKADELIAASQSGAQTVTYQVMKFLSNWLVEHINGADKKYSSIMSPTVH